MWLSLNDIRGFNFAINNDIVLREMQLSDAGELLKIRGDNKLMRFVDAPVLMNYEEAITQINNWHKDKEGFRLGIFFTNLLIGTIGLYHINFKHSFAGIGYEIKTEFQKKGIGSLALKELTDFILKHKLLHRIEAQTHTINYSSVKTLKKAGFIKEARQKGNFLFEGKFDDSFMYVKIARSRE